MKNMRLMVLVLVLFGGLMITGCSGMANNAATIESQELRIKALEERVEKLELELVPKPHYLN